MKTLLLLTMIASTLSFTVPSFMGLPTGKEQTPSSDSQMEQEVLALVNNIRRSRQLPALASSTQLTQAARYHAKDMSVDDYFDHSSHDRTASGAKQKVCNFDQRLRQFVPNIGGTWGENIAWGNPDAKSVVRAWMQSPGHRKNILNANYRYLGVGYVDGYWVQDFARSVE